LCKVFSSINDIAEKTGAVQTDSKLLQADYDKAIGNLAKPNSKSPME